MKILKYLIVLFVVLAYMSCDNKPERPDPVMSQDRIESVGETTPSNVATITNSNVKHYTCPNNCLGSGGDGAGKCPVCGTDYVHNGAYHNQGAQGQQVTPLDSGSNTVTLDPNSAGQTPPAQNTTPAQNAVGEWHYVCSKACGGGGSGAGSCPKCGSELTHNATYHNQ